MIQLDAFRTFAIAISNFTVGFMAYEEPNPFDFDAAARVNHGIALGLIGIGATAAEYILKTGLDFAEARKAITSERAQRIRFLGTLAIYAVAIITPLALGMIGPSGALWMVATYSTSFYSRVVAEDTAYYERKWAEQFKAIKSND